MRALRIVLVLAALALPETAAAVTVRDIIELTKAGLSDDVLIAVIDADRTIFTLDTNQILELKRAGVSKDVLLKMLRTRREFEPAVPDPVAPPSDPVSAAENPAWHAQEQPGLVVIGTPPPPAPVTVVVPQYLVPQYYYVPYSIWGVPSGHGVRPAPVLAPEYRGFGRFINDGWVDRGAAKPR